MLDLTFDPTRSFSPRPALVCKKCKRPLDVERTLCFEPPGYVVYCPECAEQVTLNDGAT